MFSQLKAMARSVFDWSLYDEVTRQRARRTVGYVTLLVILVGLLQSLIVTVQLRGFVRNELIPELGKLPVVTIKDHVASTNVPEPWVKSFKDPNSGLKTIVAIDTTGQTKGFAFDEQGFIITRTQLLMKNPQNPYLQPLNFSDVDDVVIDATTTERWIGLGLKIVFASCAVMLPIYNAGAKLLSALLLSVIALIPAAKRRQKLRYGQMFTIAIYALTPVTAVDLLRSALGLEIPFFWLLYLAGGAAYVWIGVTRVRDDDPALPGSPLQPTGGPPAKVPMGGPPFPV
jgi:hypothetical protein